MFCVVVFFVIFKDRLSKELSSLAINAIALLEVATPFSMPLMEIVGSKTSRDKLYQPMLVLPTQSVIFKAAFESSTVC